MVLILFQREQTEVLPLLSVSVVRLLSRHSSLLTGYVKEALFSFSQVDACEEGRCLAGFNN
jgi:hypothetical protein